MVKKNKPMPLSELPNYIKSVRENGPTDYVPVVDMGQIIDDRPSKWLKRLAYATTICLFLAIGGFYSTKEITIVSNNVGSEALAGIVKNEGGQVFTVKQEGESTYKVRVFRFRINSLIEKLRKNENLKEVQ